MKLEIEVTLAVEPRRYDQYKMGAMSFRELVSYGKVVSIPKIIPKEDASNAST